MTYRRKRTAPLVDITPLIDLIFTLLIFFALTLQFDPAAAIKLELSKAKTSSAVQQTEQITISINHQREIFFRERRMTIDELAQNLEEFAAQQKTTEQEAKVIIRVDRSVPTEGVVRVMDLAREKGLLSIQLATRRSAGE